MSSYIASRPGAHAWEGGVERKRRPRRGEGGEKRAFARGRNMACSGCNTRMGRAGGRLAARGAWLIMVSGTGTRQHTCTIAMPAVSLPPAKCFQRVSSTAAMIQTRDEHLQCSGRRAEHRFQPCAGTSARSHTEGTHRPQADAGAGSASVLMGRRVRVARACGAHPLTPDIAYGATRAAAWPGAPAKGRRHAVNYQNAK